MKMAISCGAILYVVYLVAFVILGRLNVIGNWKYAINAILFLSVISSLLFLVSLKRVRYIVLYFFVFIALIPCVATYIFLVPKSPPEAVPAPGVYAFFYTAYIFFPQLVTFVLAYVAAKLICLYRR